MSFFEQKAASLASKHEVDYSLEEYLNLCKTTPEAYANAAERMLSAIGEPELIDTAKDPVLARIFMNRTIKVYDAFKDFYGIEEPIERLVSFFQKASQGLQESKQIIHLLGPPGSSKSTLADRLKVLMEKNPIYVLADEKGVVSPIFESPLGLFDKNDDAEGLRSEYGIPRRALVSIPSPWALKRLKEYDGDLSSFRVKKMWPSRNKQVAITRVEPGDANSQDITTLIGKADIRMLEYFSQHDTDAYSYSGGLNRGSTGIVEIVEAFKFGAPMLHPLLTATADREYAGSEPIGQMPFTGILLSHTNEEEHNKFKGDPKNSAFMDRMSIIKIPYTLRATEEERIYQKMIGDSSLAEKPLAPHTTELLARFSVLTRLEKSDQSTQFAKLRVYNGDNIKDSEPRAKSMLEYKKTATENEGMTGISTRFAMKVLASTFNYDPTEIAADPVQLFTVLEQAVKREQFKPDVEKEYLAVIDDELRKRYLKDMEKIIQTAYVESYSEFGQNMFDRYLSYADAWINDIDYKDPDTGAMMNRDVLNDELTKIEKPVVANPKDFRHEVVMFTLRYRASHSGNNPSWQSFEKIKEVIESKMFGSLDSMLPVISWGTKQDSETAKKHEAFLSRMLDRGYTELQVRRLTDWFMQVRRNS